MKKTIIALIASVLAALSASFLSGHDINIEQKQIESIFVDIGENLIQEESTDDNTNRAEDLENEIVMDELRWAPGEYEDPYVNLYNHFQKHGDEVGTETAQEYYDLANDIIQDPDTIRLDDFYYIGSTDYYDRETQFIVGLNQGGSINTFFFVDSNTKLKKIEQAIAELEN